MEMKILQWIQENLRNPIMDRLMVWISYTGELGFVWILLALLFLFLPSWRRYRRLGFTMLLSLAFGGLACNLFLKPLVARPRPFVNHLDAYPYLVPFPSEYSFPSGHSTSSWSATCVGLWQRRSWMWLLAFYAFLMSFSRLYLFVHYPSDILVGFLLGLFNAYLSTGLVSVLEKRFTSLRQFLSN